MKEKEGGGYRFFCVPRIRLTVKAALFFNFFMNFPVEEVN
jgi:hypothetical protein